MEVSVLSWRIIWNGQYCGVESDGRVYCGGDLMKQNVL